MTVGLRLWVRKRILRKVGLDDWLATASLVSPFPSWYDRRWQALLIFNLKDPLLRNYGLLDSFSTLWSWKAHQNFILGTISDSLEIALDCFLPHPIRRGCSQIQYLHNAHCKRLQHTSYLRAYLVRKTAAEAPPRQITLLNDC